MSPNLLELIKQQELLALSQRELQASLLGVLLVFMLGTAIFIYVAFVWEKMKQSTDTSQKDIQN